MRASLGQVYEQAREISVVSDDKVTDSEKAAVEWAWPFEQGEIMINVVKRPSPLPSAQRNQSGSRR